MAINKKLVHFNTKAIFDQKLAEKEILDTSVVFIKDSNIIHTHGEDYQFVEWSVIGVVGSPEPPVEIPKGYAYVKPADDDWWIDAEDKVILVME